MNIPAYENSLMWKLTSPEIGPEENCSLWKSSLPGKIISLTRTMDNSNMHYPKQFLVFP